MKIISKIKAYEGQLIDSYNVTMSHEDQEFPVQVLSHPGAVCIAGSLDGIHYFMVNQFRFGINQDLLEFPAGKIDNPDEDPILAAYREFQEETGYSAKTMIPLGSMHPAGAYIDEVIHLYLAQDLSFVGQNLDPNEVLNVEMHTLEEIKDMIMNNQITDSKTIAICMKIDLLCLK